jgi:HSP20 family protein
MTLIKFKNPANINQFDRLPYFSEMVNEFVNGWTNPQTGNSTIPAVNIKETENSFDIHLAAPGFKKEDFKIAIEKDVLTISAEVKKEQEEKTESYTRKEFSYNSFSRSFNLPDFLETENIKAVYENGILGLVVPKKTEVKSSPKEIKVS